VNGATSPSSSVVFGGDGCNGRKKWAAEIKCHHRGAWSTLRAEGKGRGGGSKWSVINTALSYFLRKRPDCMNGEQGRLPFGHRAKLKEALGEGRGVRARPKVSGWSKIKGGVQSSKKKKFRLPRTGV